jgi:flagellar hook assembly protein FlgD
VIWDGRSDAGELVADGEYRYQIEAWDKKGNKGSSPLLKVVVDDTPPSVELSTAYPLFSPNGDGRLDTLTINQRDSTEEKLWQAEIQNAGGGVVRALSWEGSLEDYTWDGKEDGGKLSADGAYTYTVRSTDLAGNSATFSIDGLTIDTRPTSITLDIDSPSFSPNADGRKDLLRLYTKLTRRDDAESWELSIYNEAGEVARAYSGKGVPPGMIVFDGKNAKGERLPDGPYVAEVSVLYRNGDHPKAASPQFTIDTTPPRAALSARYLVFSPNGDGRRDNVTIRQFTSVEKLWQAAIIDGSGNTVKTASWEGTRPEMSWDGTNESGQTVPDGVYLYRISATDAADNVERVELKEIRVDTRPTPVSVSAVAGGLSPNRDGVMDNMVFALSAEQAEDIEAWSLEVVHRDGSVKKRFIGEAGTSPPARITWNGLDEGGKATEGTYQARLAVEYEKGNLSEAATGVFVLDVTPPAVKVRISPRPFSPDGDGVDDVLTMAIEAKDASPVENWSIQILDPMQHQFMDFSGRGSPRPVTWNGRSPQGELVQSAEDYPVVVTVRDNLWNTATVRDAVPVDVLVMRDGDRLKIIISSIYFKPYTADYMDTSAIDPERVARNLKTLDRLAEILKKYGDYKIRLEGHAVMIYWDQPAKAKVEQEEVLLPLSKARAEVIKAALVKRGITAGRMTTAGFGGLYPVVPHSDEENRWKSRRVEFILIKQ